MKRWDWFNTLPFCYVVCRDWFFGEGGGTRTPDILGVDQAFRPTELRPQFLVGAEGIEPTRTTMVPGLRPGSPALTIYAPKLWHVGQASNLHFAILEIAALPVKLPTHMKLVSPGEYRRRIRG